MSEQQLHKTIKQVIDKHGTEIMADLRLMYILSDYSAFDKLSDQHDIVKALQSEGYGQQLLDCKAKSDPDWQNTIGVFINTFLTTHSQYDAADVIYLCDSIAYGAGLLSENNIRKGNTEAKPVQNNDPIDYASELKKLQNEYIALLNSSIAVPAGKLFKKPSGYFPIDAQNRLYILEQKIWMLGQELGKDMVSWCTIEKQNVLNKYSHPLKVQRLGIIAIIAAPAIAVIIAITSLVSYLGAKDDVSTFNVSIAHADSLYQARDYYAAAEAYKNAGEAYGASYKRNKYKGIAKTGARRASSSIVNVYLDKVQPLYDNKDYYEAIKVLHSMPEGVDVSFDNALSKRLTAMEADLTTKCGMQISSELDGFIKAISKSKGKPSKDVLDRIDYLLTVDPSNYWLNFIKNKSSQK